MERERVNALHMAGRRGCSRGGLEVLSGPVATGPATTLCHNCQRMLLVSDQVDKRPWGDSLRADGDVISPLPHSAPPGHGQHLRVHSWGSEPGAADRVWRLSLGGTCGANQNAEGMSLLRRGHCA